MKLDWKTTRVSLCLALMLAMLAAGFGGLWLMPPARPEVPSDSVWLWKDGPRVRMGLGQRKQEDPFVRLQRDYDDTQSFSFYLGMQR